MKHPRRRFLHLAAGAAALPAVSRRARAQAYPTRPVRIIVRAVFRSAHRSRPRCGSTAQAFAPVADRVATGLRQALAEDELLGFILAITASNRRTRAR
jgi:hypothetical protein